MILKIRRKITAVALVTVTAKATLVTRKIDDSANRLSVFFKHKHWKIGVNTVKCVHNILSASAVCLVTAVLKNKVSVKRNAVNLRTGKLYVCILKFLVRKNYCVCAKT